MAEFNDLGALPVRGKARGKCRGAYAKTRVGCLDSEIPTGFLRRIVWLAPHVNKEARRVFTHHCKQIGSTPEGDNLDSRIARLQGREYVPSTRGVRIEVAQTFRDEHGHDVPCAYFLEGRENWIVALCDDPAVSHWHLPVDATLPFGPAFEDGSILIKAQGTAPASATERSAYKEMMRERRQPRAVRQEARSAGYAKDDDSLTEVSERRAWLLAQYREARTPEEEKREEKERAAEEEGAARRAEREEARREREEARREELGLDPAPDLAQRPIRHEDVSAPARKRRKRKRKKDNSTDATTTRSAEWTKTILETQDAPTGIKCQACGYHGLCMCNKTPINW